MSSRMAEVLDARVKPLACQLARQEELLRQIISHQGGGGSAAAATTGSGVTAATVTSAAAAAPHTPPRKATVARPSAAAAAGTGQYTLGVNHLTVESLWEEWNVGVNVGADGRKASVRSLEAVPQTPWRKGRRAMSQAMYERTPIYRAVQAGIDGGKSEAVAVAEVQALHESVCKKAQANKGLEAKKRTPVASYICNLNSIGARVQF